MEYPSVELILSEVKIDSGVLTFLEIGFSLGILVCAASIPRQRRLGLNPSD